MIIHRQAHTRANPKRDWISSFRTFSFPPYFDPKYINFSYLQTINDDRVQPNGHVPMHEHKNMKIFGYVVEEESVINIVTNTETEIILFDLK